MSGSARVAEAIRRLTGRAGLQLDAPQPCGVENLGADHPRYALASEARDEAIAALERNETHYTDVGGIKPLREKVASVLKGWGLPATETDLLCPAGEQEARFLALQTLSRAGYKLALPEVVHPGARKAAAMREADATTFAVDANTLEPDLDSAKRALAGGKTALYLESPNRLTGKVIARAKAEAIAAAVKEAGGAVVWDASLVPWLVPGTECVAIGALDGMADRTVTIGTLWPGTGVDAWLIAYLSGPADFVNPARSIKQVIAICTSSPVQWGALGALKSGEDAHKERVAQLADIRAKAVAKAGGRALPGETVNVVAVQVPGGNVASLPGAPAPGDGFGRADVARFLVTPTGEIIEALAVAAGSKSGGAA
ncbi:MAG: aminotransferase class I/II-fold pyridoxal phosphate-dependent enzyme [Armatimonadetes bacterium]|nr:aminotransferase class I/II-fold pyridoxal phosphate-dependent enzyme [Armatimonadota bacterium]